METFEKLQKYILLYSYFDVICQDLLCLSTLYGSVSNYYIFLNYYFYYFRFNKQ